MLAELMRSEYRHFYHRETRNERIYSVNRDRQSNITLTVIIIRIQQSVTRHVASHSSYCVLIDFEYTSKRGDFTLESQTNCLFFLGIFF